MRFPIRLTSIFLIPLLAAFNGWSQEKAKPKPGDVMIEKYLAAETDKLSKKFLDGAKTIEEWKAKRPRLYREYMDMLGLWPIPEKTPLKVTITGTVETPDCIIDNLHFQSKPGLYVTANLYRPLDSASGGRKPPDAKTKQYPAVLYVCGHTFRGRDGNKSAFQQHGMWFAKNGYICLVLDTLQLGEIPGVHHGTYGWPWVHLRSYGVKDKDKLKLETRWWWHSAGYTPAGVECWNGVRGIDYLVSRPDVDTQKIAVTGISGGGAATFWIAAADDRVQCAVPVSGMSDLESYVKNKVINGHCDCMFLYNTYQWDWTTIAALVAPRPLLFANSDNDPIFPMDGNRRIIAKLRKIYTLYGKPELVDEYVSKGGHAYRPDLRLAIFKWINRHTKNDTTTPVEDTKFAELPGMLLRVFRDDADVPKDALNAKIDETFVPRAKLEIPEKAKFPEWKKALIAKVHENSFHPFPNQIPVAEGELMAGPLRFFSLPLQSEHGIDIFVDIPRKLKKQETTGWLLVCNSLDPAKIPAGEKSTPELIKHAMDLRDPEWIKPIAKKEFKVLLSTRGTWFDVWAKKSPPNYVERSHLLLGRTVDQGRVFDIVSAIGNLNSAIKNQTMTWKVLGKGQAGILAAYAALFEPSIKEVVIIDPPKSHKDGPYFLGVLRVLDIPEALGLLAPNVKLTLINAKDSAFDRTEQIYKLAGAADKFVRK
jgi:dienelactone hydrolase